METELRIIASDICVAGYYANKLKIHATESDFSALVDTLSATLDVARAAEKSFSHRQQQQQGSAATPVLSQGHFTISGSLYDDSDTEAEKEEPGKEVFFFSPPEERAFAQTQNKKRCLKRPQQTSVVVIERPPAKMQRISGPAEPAEAPL